MATSGKINLTARVKVQDDSFIGDKVIPSGADPRFLDVLDSLWQLHIRKGADYGRDGDPYANIRQYEELGLEPWVQCVGDIMENLGRVKSFIKNGNLKNDPMENSLLDIASYAIIAYILYNEYAETPVPKPDESELDLGHSYGCSDGQCRGCVIVD